MLCSGCGKDVPFVGVVCPYCQRDKKSDQGSTVAIGIGLVVGGFIGNLIAGFTGLLIGGFVLGMIATAISMSRPNHSARKPPKVRIATEPSFTMKPTKNPATILPADDRLRQLQALKSEGLITEEEFQQKRTAIITAI